MLIVRT